MEQLNAYKDEDHKKFLGKILVEKGVLTNEQFTTIMLDQQRLISLIKSLATLPLKKDLSGKAILKKPLKSKKIF